VPVIDFSGVQELEALPEDTYPCIIADVSREVAKEAGKYDYYKVKFTVSDDSSDANGRAVYRNYSTSPKSLWALKQFMIIAGTDPEKFEGEVDVDEEMLELKGADVEVTVAVKTYNDKLVNEVTKVAPPGI